MLLGSSPAPGEQGHGVVQLRGRRLVAAHGAHARRRSSAFIETGIPRNECRVRPSRGYFGSARSARAKTAAPWIRRKYFSGRGARAEKASQKAWHAGASSGQCCIGRYAVALQRHAELHDLVPSRQPALRHNAGLVELFPNGIEVRCSVDPARAKLRQLRQRLARRTVLGFADGSLWLGRSPGCSEASGRRPSPSFQSHKRGPRR
jgi:hypothetical protein